MIRVEHRFLQVIISHVSGDRLTLALLHWDGSTLRIADSMNHLDFCDPSQREIVERTVRAKIRKARAAAREMGGIRNIFGLAHVFPVREGLGAGLYWTPIVASETRNPAAHFEQLKAEARLVQAQPSQHQPFRNKDISRRLVDEATQLQSIAPERVVVENEVKRLQSYKAPVSWKNGRWHHAVPFSLDGLDEDAMTKRVRDLIGLVELCIPQGDIAVPVAVLPTSTKLAAAAMLETENARVCLAERGAQIVLADRFNGSVSLDPVIEKIRSDIEQ